MTAPPKYPRVPHLASSEAATAADRVLSTDERRALLRADVVVEEKLDGANVMLWNEDGRVQCSLRSGPGSADRAGQLGPLRAWVAERGDQLRTLLGDGAVLYGEWLWVTHTVAYDRLRSYLVGLDLRRGDGSFLTVEKRNAACTAAGVECPPELYRGIPRRVEAIEHLLGPSRYGSFPAEGVVIRPLDGSKPRVAKLLRPGFERLADDAWARGRPRNTLAAGRADVRGSVRASTGRAPGRRLS